MGEGVFTYRAENGNVCEIVDTFKIIQAA